MSRADDPRRIRTRAAVLIVALIAAASSFHVAGAPAITGASPTTNVTLVSQSASVLLGGTFHVRLRVRPRAAALRVAVTIHNQVTSMAAFEAANRDPDPQLGEVPDTAVDATLTTARNGDVLAAVDLQAPGDVARRTTLTALEPGIYPLELAAFDGRQKLDTVVTWLVTRDPRQRVAGVDLAWIWQLTSPPLRRSDGTFERAATDRLLASGRLGKAAALLPSAADTPITLLVTPELAESWQLLATDKTRPEFADGFANLTQAAANTLHQVVASSYVITDPPTLETNRLGTAFANAWRDGREALQHTFQIRVDGHVAFLPRVTAPTLARLRALGVDQVVLRSANVTRAPTRTLDAAFAVDGTALTGAVVDEQFVHLLQGNAAPGIRAQRYLAALTLLALETPARPLGLVLATPSHWTPDASLVRAVIHATTDFPYARFVTLREWFAATARSGTRALTSVPTRELAITDDAYRAAQAQLTSLRDFVGANDATVRRGERALALAIGDESDGGDATAGFGQIESAARGFLTRISTSSRTVTITARRASIPLSFTNATGRAVHIRVTLASPKLLFPKGASSVIVLAKSPANTTVNFPVEARASGQFAIDVTIGAPNGSITSPPTQVTVNSTVFGSIGTLLTVGALVFLALWWANHVRRTRSVRRSTP